MSSGHRLLGAQVAEEDGHLMLDDAGRRTRTYWRGFDGGVLAIHVSISVDTKARRWRSQRRAQSWKMLEPPSHIHRPRISARNPKPGPELGPATRRHLLDVK